MFHISRCPVIAQVGYLHMVQNGDLDCAHMHHDSEWLDAAMRDLGNWLMLGGADEFDVGTFGSIWADKVLAGRTTRIGLICRSEIM